MRLYNSIHWQNISKMKDSALERFSVYYFWMFSAIYLAYIVIHFAKNSFGIDLMPKMSGNSNFPLGIVIIGLQATTYYLGNHLFHSFAPKLFEGKLDEAEIYAQLSTLRTKIEEEREQLIRQVNRSIEIKTSAGFVDLREKMGQEEAAKAISLLNMQLAHSYVAGIVDSAQEKLLFTTYENVSKSHPVARIACSSLFFISICLMIVHFFEMIEFITATIR